VGGHDSGEEKGDGQFRLFDERDVAEVHAAILGRGLQPVYTDYIPLHK
jgi:2-iminoacetate synthase